MKSKVSSRPSRRLLDYPIFGLVLGGAVALALTSPGATRAHDNCWIEPHVPALFGSYPNEQATASGWFHCSVTYSGYAWLRGWNGSSWNQIAESYVAPRNTDAYPYAGGYCWPYNFVDTHMYGNFSGHGHTNTSSSTACNFP
ncbi:MAG: hypothetical protein ACREXY_05110 [Gammaproteobacteria bacterium]